MEKVEVHFAGGHLADVAKADKGDSPRAGPILAYLNSKNLPALIGPKTARRDAHFKPCPWSS